jgi:hypothetical protein
MISDGDHIHESVLHRILQSRLRAAYPASGAARYISNGRRTSCRAGKG